MKTLFSGPGTAKDIAYRNKGMKQNMSRAHKKEKEKNYE